MNSDYNGTRILRLPMSIIFNPSLPPCLSVIYAQCTQGGVSSSPSHRVFVLLQHLSQQVLVLAMHPHTTELLLLSDG